MFDPGYNCYYSPSICYEVCGDHVKTASEECEDENTSSGDGCSAYCLKEPNF